MWKKVNKYVILSRTDISTRKVKYIIEEKYNSEHTL
jgi:hypothetical protein